MDFDREQALIFEQDEFAENFSRFMPDKAPTGKKPWEPDLNCNPMEELRMEHPHLENSEYLRILEARRR